MGNLKQIVIAAAMVVLAVVGFWLYQHRSQDTQQPAQSAPQPDGYGSMKIPPQQ